MHAIAYRMHLVWGTVNAIAGRILRRVELYSTAATSPAFAPFDPRSATPVECPQGAPAAQCTAMKANYQLAPNFGQPLNDLAYQRPRTYRISLGARF